MERDAPTQAATQLWMRALAEGRQSVRGQLVAHYIGFARSVAARVYRMRTSEGIAFDDYLQWANVGLLESVDRFDPARGIVFEAYAVHRIRGAILNGLGSASELLAQRAAWHDRVQSRIESLQSEEQTPPPAQTLQSLADMVAALAFGFLLEGDAQEWNDSRSGGSPYQSAEIAQARERIHRLLAELPDREARIIRLHYFEGVEFQEIAAEWGLSKGRISQLHSQALQRLRTLFAKSRIQYDHSL